MSNPICRDCGVEFIRFQDTDFYRCPNGCTEDYADTAGGWVLLHLEDLKAYVEKNRPQRTIRG